MTDIPVLAMALGVVVLVAGFIWAVKDAIRKQRIAYLRQQHANLTNLLNVTDPRMVAAGMVADELAEIDAELERYGEWHKAK